jgi:hypothetical protein
VDAASAERVKAGLRSLHDIKHRGRQHGRGPVWGFLADQAWLE